MRRRTKRRQKEDKERAKRGQTEDKEREREDRGQRKDKEMMEQGTGNMQRIYRVRECTLTIEGTNRNPSDLIHLLFKIRIWPPSGRLIPPVLATVMFLITTSWPKPLRRYLKEQRERKVEAEI